MRRHTAVTVKSADPPGENANLLSLLVDGARDAMDGNGGAQRRGGMIRLRTNAL
jgi:hypothetical protein